VELEVYILKMAADDGFSGVHLEKTKTTDDFVLPRRGKYAGREDDLRRFATYLKQLQRKYGLKASARGNAYLLEQEGQITKDDFDWAEGLVLECIKDSYLPVDFVKQDPARTFFGVEEPDYDETPVEYFTGQLHYTVKEGGGYTPNYWENEDKYVQIIVEKVDLITLFRPDDDDIARAARAGITLEPICQDHKIPIANSKGWSSVLQRATFARRFKEMEERGLDSVLLVVGDHDPDGIRITDFYRTNLEQIQGIHWSDGTQGYNPDDLEIKRIGLNYDFIQRYDVPSIDNLITARGGDLADPGHRNHQLPYVQDYLREYGEKKWEAQALIQRPIEAQQLLKQELEGLLGVDAKNRFKEKEQAVIDEMWDYIERCRATKSINRLLEGD
jgi:hypothetical protein